MGKKRDSFAHESRPGQVSPVQRFIMPKPIRLLMGASLALFVFLVVQIVRSPSSPIPLPGDRHKVEELTRDPNLDRMFPESRSALGRAVLM